MKEGVVRTREGPVSLARAVRRLVSAACEFYIALKYGFGNPDGVVVDVSQYLGIVSGEVKRMLSTQFVFIESLSGSGRLSSLWKFTELMLEELGLVREGGG